MAMTLEQTIDKLKRGEEVVASATTIVSPSYVPDLIHAALDLLLDGETGIWHLTNQGAVSWHDLAREAAAIAGLDRTAVRRIRGSEDAAPVDTSLDSNRGVLLQPLDRALRDLSNEEREIITLKYLDGLSYEEIAARLEIPKGTVMSRLFYARKAMQAKLS